MWARGISTIPAQSGNGIAMAAAGQNNPARIETRSAGKQIPRTDFEIRHMA
jgi:hypothetical protein